jgi:hypothetical protein
LSGSESLGKRAAARTRSLRRALIGAITAIAFAATAVSGCATVRSRVERNPLAALSDSGALYLVIPVRGNEELVTLALTAFTGKASAQKVVERTDVVYACTQGPSAETQAADTRTVRVIATGSFPKSAAGFAFRESAGWERRSASGMSWYHAPGVDVAIPARGTLCAVASGSGAGGENSRGVTQDAEIRDLLARVASGNALGGAVSREFATYAANAANSGPIGFFVADPDIIAQRILGPDVSLPMRFAEGYAERQEDGAYALRARITLADARSAKALRPLIARAFRGAEVSVDGDAVTVSGFRVEKEKLAELAFFSYLEKK